MIIAENLRPSRDVRVESLAFVIEQLRPGPASLTMNVGSAFTCLICPRCGKAYERANSRIAQHPMAACFRCTIAAGKAKNKP